jgi:uncharacterized damage-inducible protein DinB
MADKSNMLAAHYRMFGRYNAWANGRLLAAAGLSIEQYRADRGAFFKSVHGTLALCQYIIRQYIKGAGLFA